VEGYCSYVGRWPFASILALALALASNYASVEMPKFAPLYLNGWAL